MIEQVFSLYVFTLTQLHMVVPLSSEVRILNHNIPADAWHQNGS